MGIVDSDIIDDIISGNDAKVVNSLYKDIYPNVERYLKKNNGSKEEAEDCFQEALMKFYKQVLSGEFNPKYKVHGYIYSVSIRLWLNNVKRERSKVSLDELDDKLLKVDLSDDPTSFGNDKNDLIMGILSKLGEKCKNILYHAIYSDLINEDIMVRFGYTSIAAVKMQHKRCKQKMIKLLKTYPELEYSLRS